MTDTNTGLHPAVTRLRQLFAARLLEQEPSSVLDVACGDAHLLRALREGDVHATGLEYSDRRIVQARAEGLEVLFGSAESLPFEDARFDWCAMRHAAHHLTNPDRGLCECARVARTGIVVAEPWREKAEPTQQLGAEWDLFTRVLERRRGDVHHDDLVITSMIARLPVPDEWVSEYTYFQPTGTRALADVEAQAAALNPFANPEEQRELERLLAAVRKIGIGITGTAILVARRRPT